MSSLQVVGKYRGAKTISGIVCRINGFLLACEACDDDYRACHDLLAFEAWIYWGIAASLTKDLFFVDSHALFDTGEDCGLNIEALVALRDPGIVRCATCHNRSTFRSANVDI